MLIHTKMMGFIKGWGYMQDFKGNSSIRKRLARITMAVIFLITMLFSLFCLILFRHFLRNNLLQYTELNLALLSENISKELINIEFMVKECASSKDIIQYFEKSYFAGSGQYSEAYSSLYKEYAECASHQFINYLVLCDYEDSNNFMQIVGRNTPFYRISMSDIEASDCYSDFSEKPSDFIAAIDYSPLEYKDPQKVITMIYPVGAGQNTPPDAFLYVEISLDIITNYIENYEIDEKCHVFISANDVTYRVHEDNLIVDHLSLYEDQEILTQYVNFADWTIYQSVSSYKIFQQAKFFLLLSLAVILLVIIFGILYSVYLNRLIAVPVYKLRKRLIAISYGHFDTDPEIEWYDEFGDIGRGINSMAKHISELMDKRVADQKAKSDLEYQMLLSQMTPHFVYNTLNSIRWMAQIQNAEGISEMTGALARLMKNISKLPDIHIPVSKEFELVNDYFTIIKLRYGSTITLTYNIPDASVTSCDIVKFTLQPLVENAIFHGIEPKHKTGSIAITADKKDDSSFYIEIADDGIGICPEKIPGLLHEDVTHTSDGLIKHMGLYNVNKRLQHAFGRDYGLTITSEPGKFTKVTVTLPYTKGDDSYVETDHR